MHDNLGNHANKEVLDQTDGETEAGPIVAELHNLKAVAVEVDVAFKVHLMEGLHGNLLLAIVLALVLRLLESKVVLDALARVLGLLVLSRANRRDNHPVGSQERQTGEHREEEGSLGATTELPGEPVRWNDQDRGEAHQGEAVIACGIGWQGSIFDGGVLEDEGARSACANDRGIEKQVRVEGRVEGSVRTS